MNYSLSTTFNLDLLWYCYQKLLMLKIKIKKNITITMVFSSILQFHPLRHVTSFPRSHHNYSPWSVDCCIFIYSFLRHTVHLYRSRYNSLTIIISFLSTCKGYSCWKCCISTGFVIGLWIMWICRHKKHQNVIVNMKHRKSTY